MPSNDEISFMITSNEENENATVQPIQIDDYFDDRNSSMGSKEASSLQFKKD